jgi:gluconokinase
VTVEHPPVLVVMGVSGVGKTTVATALAARLGWPEEEGDRLHPEANVAKMAAAVPLTDDDRWPWLDRVAQWIDDRIADGRPGVITCSALKRAYRDRLRRPEVIFVHLAAPAALIEDRMSRREGHFMPPALLASQLDTLEPLQPDERGMVVDTGPSTEKIVDTIVEGLQVAPSA